MKSLCCALILSMLASTAFAAYESPDSAGLGVDLASISLPESTRANLATAIVKCCGNLGPEQAALLPRLLAVAHLVSPDNRDFIVADARLKKGQSLPKDGTWVPQKTAQGLATLADRLKTGNNAERHLAGYFLSLASDLDRANDDYVFLLAAYEKSAGTVDWAGLRKKAGAATPSAPASTPDPVRLTIVAGAQAHDADTPPAFQRNQAKVNGLVVRDIGATLSGDILEILITVLPWHEPHVTYLEFATPVGEDMKVSFDEAISLLRTRHPNLPAGKKMRVSFDDKYVPKDGGSAGLAFALLGFALLDGLEFDPAAAVTGDVTVDWLVRGVGGVAAKVDGAQRNGKSLVVIPAVNAGDIEDMVLLDGAGVLMKTQIFAVENVSQAIEILRKDRTRTLQDAMDSFAKLGAALDAGRSPAQLLSSQTARKLAADAVADAPQHLSAQYVLKLMGGWRPEKLSLEGSLSEVSGLLWPYTRVLRGYGDAELDAITDEILIESMIRAQRLTEYADPQVQALVASLSALVSAHADYRQSKKDGAAFRAQLQKHREVLGTARLQLKGLGGSNRAAQNPRYVAYEHRTAVLTELRRLSTNHHFMKALVQ